MALIGSRKSSLTEPSEKFDAQCGEDEEEQIEK